MDIKIPHSLLSKYLETNASPKTIAKYLTLCGPSVDRLEKINSDTIYHTEIITNRIDTASAFGLAREASAILPQFGFKAKLKNNPYNNQQKLPKPVGKTLKLDIQILDQSLISRFSTVILKDLLVKPSPKEIQNQLITSGQRPINNLVDITNYLTLCLGQPCHIFDYTKIKNHLLKLKNSKKGEKITTLDGRQHILNGGDIVIEDGSGQLIDLCGVMGGKLSEVDENTTTAVLFIQTYQSEKIRKTSLFTQERTLAAQIFEKNPDPELVFPTIIEGVNLLQKYANGKIASHLIDIYPKKPKSKTIRFPLSKIESISGTTISPNQITSILEPLGIKSKISNQQIKTQIPSWRHHDLSIPEDIIEEIIRIYGYFRLPSHIPSISIAQKPISTLLEKEYEVKTILTHLGFTEIYNFSLISKKLFEKASISIDHSIEIKNPLTSDFQFLRRSLIPQALDTLSKNRGKTPLPQRIFELSNIYTKTEGKLPNEQPILTIASVGVDFFQSKGELESFFNYLKLTEIRFSPLSENSLVFNQNKTAEIYSKKEFLGIIGEINPQTSSKFQLENPIIINLDFNQVINSIKSITPITPPSTFPSIIENITLTSKKPVGHLIKEIKKIKDISLIKYLNSFKNKHTFEIHFNSPKINLTQKDIEPHKKKITLIS